MRESGPDKSTGESPKKLELVWLGEATHIADFSDFSPRCALESDVRMQDDKRWRRESIVKF